MEKLTQTFEAKTPTGKSVTLFQYQEFISTRTLSGDAGPLPGLKRLTTTEGYHVNRIDKGVYEIVETGERLHTNDPKAP